MSIDALLQKLVFQDGLIPAIIVDADGRVLTLCYLNREALEKTLETGLVHVFRRSRGRIMLKGEASGHTQRLKEVRADCEGKSLMLLVEQHVAACHAGYRTCYYRRYRPTDGSLEVCEERVFDPDKVYGSRGTRGLEDGAG
jgi:phosphoribosyl-AMP cyclohydrolase